MSAVAIIGTFASGATELATAPTLSQVVVGVTLGVLAAGVVFPLLA